ncbi:hypothetical protein [Leptothrix ochracea]|uniref:hypothetical protein n=1 Tax=Leptothrix ochracea TaxID=735331 RepID=UPI0034E26593
MTAPLLPPVYRDARRLLVHTDALTPGPSPASAGEGRNAVLKPLAHVCGRGVGVRAWAARRPPPLGPGFAAFETAALLAAGIGQQCGGWLKALSASSQANNPRAQVGSGAAPTAGPPPTASRKVEPPARPASLSTRAALGSCEPEAQP